MFVHCKCGACSREEPVGGLEMLPRSHLQCYTHAYGGSGDEGILDLGFSFLWGCFTPCRVSGVSGLAHPWSRARSAEGGDPTGGAARSPVLAWNKRRLPRPILSLPLTLTEKHRQMGRKRSCGKASGPKPSNPDQLGLCMTSNSVPAELGIKFGSLHVVYAGLDNHLSGSRVS